MTSKRHRATLSIVLIATLSACANIPVVAPVTDRVVYPIMDEVVGPAINPVVVTLTNPFLGKTEVNYSDSSWCIPRKLKGVLRRVSRLYGPVQVVSSKRWWWENKRKGGAKNSYHLQCKAVDFYVDGANPSEVIAYLKTEKSVGGYKYYSSGHYHIDTGPRRTW